MDKTLQILAVDKDPKLRLELEAAIAGTKLNVVTHLAPDMRRGIEAARSFQPDLVLVAMGRDMGALKAFTDEILAIAPESVVAATYRRDTFTPDRAEGTVIIDALRARVQDFLSRPLSSADLGQLLERITKRASTNRAALGTMVSFVSNKGGVGKSTMSVNTACALASRHPDRVLLVDASLQLGNCASMLDLQPETTIADAVKQVNRIDETMLHELSTRHACGLRFLAAPHDAVEAAEITPEAIARVLNVARRAFDYVVVDTFPMVDNVVIAILDVSDRVFVVFQGTVPTVLGIASFLKLLSRVGVPPARQGLVLNHNHPGFVGSLRPVDVADKLERTIDHVVPFDKNVLVATNTGVPRVLSGGGFLGFGAGFSRAVGVVADAVESTRESARATPTRALTAEAPPSANGNTPLHDAPGEEIGDGVSEGAVL
ncbi:MAG TPA: AAA family ATPase [Planctomycetota bacterium]|nr:AAA family ATPase [Planctomycetota bacterium]